MYGAGPGCPRRNVHHDNRRQAAFQHVMAHIAGHDRMVLVDAWLSVGSIRGAWDKMCAALGMPKDGEAGEKLIRRSVATLARTRMGEERWQQGRMMLGHVRVTVSDLYALRNAANLGVALATTEALIDEIEALAPGAFCRDFTARAGQLSVAS